MSRVRHRAGPAHESRPSFGAAQGARRRRSALSTDPASHGAPSTPADGTHLREGGR